jgi:hypothetical protein
MPHVNHRRETVRKARSHHRNHCFRWGAYDGHYKILVNRTMRRVNRDTIKKGLAWDAWDIILFPGNLDQVIDAWGWD